MRATEKKCYVIPAEALSLGEPDYAQYGPLLVHRMPVSKISQNQSSFRC